MTPKDRYMTALRGGKPDQVPVSLSIGPSNAKRWLGRDDWKAVLEAHEIVGSIPAQDFGLDYYTTDTNPIFKIQWASGWGEVIDTRPIPGSEGSLLKTRKIFTPTGVLTSQERLDQGEYIHGQTLEPLIKVKDDYQVYISYILQWLDSAEIVAGLDAGSDIEAILGQAGVWVTWNIHSFYQYFWVLRRVEEFLVDFYDDPGLMKEIMATTWKLNEKFMQAFNASSSPLLVCNLSGASASIISPKFFQEWIYPELEWMVQAAGPDKFIAFHLTGKIRDLMPIMLEAKPHAILRFESPRFGGDISLREVKNAYGDKICIMGGFDPHFYTEGDREAIRRETIRCIDEAAAGGGYILVDTDHIPDETELEDVKYMVEIATQYGQY